MSLIFGRRLIVEKLFLKAKRRDVFGKKLKKYRKAGLLPAVVYGHNFDSLPLFVDKKDFKKVYKQAGTSTILTLELEDKKLNVIVHDIAKDPISQEPEHVDFYHIKMTEKITAEVPLKFVGEAPAAKIYGAIIVKNFEKIEVECYPSDLPHEIEVDLSLLTEIDSVIYVKDLNIPEKVKVLVDEEEAVAVATPPSAEEIEETVESEEIGAGLAEEEATQTFEKGSEE